MLVLATCGALGLSSGPVKIGRPIAKTSTIRCVIIGLAWTGVHGVGEAPLSKTRGPTGGPARMILGI